MNALQALIGRSWRWLVQPALVLGILLAGFVLASNLGRSRRPPERSERTEYAPLARSLVAPVADHPLVLRATGTLRARSQVDVLSEVGGKAIRVHPDLRPGGLLSQGDLLVQVEPRDFELALERARADLSSALVAREYERAKAETDVWHWEQLSPEQAMPSLVARGPQLAEAEARVRSARAAITQAELDLSRTQIHTEFPGRVVSADVEIGEVIAAGQSLAVLYNTERYELPVPLEVEHVDRLRATGDELVTRVRLELGGRIREIPGRLVRIEGVVDARSRLVKAVVEIVSSELSESDRGVLMPGLFLQVEFEAGRLGRTTRLPSGALRNEGKLLLIEDGRLHLVDPEVAWRDADDVYISGLPDPVEVVVSTLNTFTEGMAVRTTRDAGQQP